MKPQMLLLAATLLAVPSYQAPELSAGEPELVLFNRDIRPILSNHCFQCHGPAATDRKADLRLDEAEGVAAVFADRLDSEAWQRLVSTDPDYQMPPPSAHRELKQSELALVKRWVEQGAVWQDHWSFLPVHRPELPASTYRGWTNNPIDRFVARRLGQAGLQPMPEADRETLLRRVTFDLTGLPPTLAEIDAFQSDSRPDAYERVVQRLLSSAHYGERMALAWMDAARYGDTSVYHADGPRDMWPWRDWVIRAYNANMPFDQFTVEQLAGDQLPDATVEQRVASGFHRNLGTTDEGGAIDEEYRVEYNVDRVNTTSAVWMGLTMECARCHDHKYDPISQEEFYRFYAFFNQSADKGMQTRNGNAPPLTNVFDPIKQRQAIPLRKRIDRLKEDLDAYASTREDLFAKWLQDQAARPNAEEQKVLAAYFSCDEGEGEQLIDSVDTSRVGKLHGGTAWQEGKFGRAIRTDGNHFATITGIADFERDKRFTLSLWVRPEGKVTGAVLSKMDDGNSHRGYDVLLGNGQLSVHLIHQWPDDAIKVTTKGKLAADAWSQIIVSYDGSSQASGVAVFFNGQLQELNVDQDSLQGTIRTDKPLTLGRRTPGSPFTGRIDEVRVHSEQLSVSQVARLATFNPLLRLARLAAEQRTAEQTSQLRAYYLRQVDDGYRKRVEQIAELEKRIGELERPISTVMIMEDLPSPRTTYVLNRGNYDSPLKDRPVQPGTPHILPPMPAGDGANRLTMARWLVDPQHPLTARVAVNRYWAMFFGAGIVRTLGDFGSQGEWPTHPQLLDYLAADFVQSGWNVKHMVRMIVTSATYRQASRTTAEAMQIDPDNRLLSRGPRFRLPGEFIRDNALAASGLLAAGRIGGPGVKPYQPEGLWNEVSLSGNVRFVQDHGENLYRRSMYIYWKRSSPMPSLTIFDTPSREKCTLQRSRTNTPLQALVTLNDPQFVEAARELAARAMRSGEPDRRGQIQYAYRLATGHRPTAIALQGLLETYEQERQTFQADLPRATALLGVGEFPRNEKLDPADHAAMTVVASILLNLDQTLTRG